MISMYQNRNATSPEQYTYYLKKNMKYISLKTIYYWYNGFIIELSQFSAG